MQKIQEIYEYKKGKISVFVKINYADNEISILDKDLANKKFLFCKRGSEFMNGWLEVIDTLREAIVEAKCRMELYRKERGIEKFEEDLVICNLIKEGN